MGKGDRRSEKGKRWSSSYGNVRPKKGDKKTAKDRVKKQQG